MMLGKIRCAVKLSCHVNNDLVARATGFLIVRALSAHAWYWWDQHASPHRGALDIWFRESM
jgi:hypothetical protein